MRIKDGFVLRDVCGETVIAGEGLGAVDFGKLLVLNDTATWLWQEAERQELFSIESLATRMCEEYDVEQAIAESDISRILEKWRDLSLIE